MITALVDTLPRISSLTVVCYIFDLVGLDQIIRMIDHWRDHLVTLKLYLFQQTYCPETDVGIRDNQRDQLRAQTVALFDSINRAQFLKHLTLELENFDFNDSPVFKAPLTILSKLSTFYFDSPDLTEYFYCSLIWCASNNRALRTGTKDWTIKLKELLQIDPQVCDTFSYVEFKIPRNGQYDKINLFCGQFSSLVHLRIIDYSRNLAITRLGLCLSQLSQLVHLATDTEANPLDENLPEHLQELSADEIVPVPSVRLLSLAMRITAHSGTERFLLHKLFPNVQVLSLRSDTRSCTDCGLFTTDEMYVKERFKNETQMRQCAHLARLPFRRFPRLHTIEIDANDSSILSNLQKRFITKDEL